MRAFVLAVLLAAMPSHLGHTAISGNCNLAIGIGSADNITTGSYNFCVGENTCKKMATTNCVIDVKLPLHYSQEFPPESVLGVIGFALVNAVDQNKHCGFDKRRISTLIKIAIDAREKFQIPERKEKPDEQRNPPNRNA